VAGSEDEEVEATDKALGLGLSEEETGDVDLTCVSGMGVDGIASNLGERTGIEARRSQEQLRQGSFVNIVRSSESTCNVRRADRNSAFVARMASTHSSLCSAHSAFF